MKWVKATERLPKDYDLYAGKILEIGDGKKTFFYTQLFFNGYEFTDIQDNWQVQWLDESEDEQIEDSSDGLKTAIFGTSDGLIQRFVVGKSEKTLVCSLDQQQCQDSCEHKDDRSKCHFTKIKNEPFSTYTRDGY